MKGPIPLDRFIIGCQVIRVGIEGRPHTLVFIWADQERYGQAVEPIPW